jgi:RNAse (barnase) inhibitor barstar
MFEKNALYKIGGQSLISIKMRKDEFDNLLNSYRFDESRKNVVILLRGSQMKSVDALFEEITAAFQFPSYFGKNWSALDECINDLDWLPGNNYIIGINDFQDLLIDEGKEELDTLFKILNNACTEWGSPADVGKEWGREGKPFHFLLQYDEKDSDFVKERFSTYVNLSLIRTK